MKYLNIKFLLITSFSLLIVGLVLSVNWFPVSTVGMTEEQKQYLLEIGSIHRPLGSTMIFLSKILFTLVVIKGLYVLIKSLIRFNKK
ncbi:hypothetical protein J2Z51_002247 [Enterococcus alcedinis]|nr:hypothetical protein [Enterococcus alcedinis]